MFESEYGHVVQVKLNSSIAYDEDLIVNLASSTVISFLFSKRQRFG